MDISLRCATVSDLEQINKIEETLEHRILSYPTLSYTLGKDANCFYVATIDNHIIAYICAEVLVDHIDILSIAVLKEYRRKNVATLLLNKLFDFCKTQKISDVFLEVRQTNINAICFYEKIGFEKISKRNNYYADTHEDAYIYKKTV